MGMFVPIEPNPYIVGNPIRDPKMFFGREEDFRYLREKLGGEARHAVVVLCGGRRSGKTSILLQILDGRLGAGYVPVLIDMQQMADSRRDVHFWRRVMTLVGERLAQACPDGIPESLRREGIERRFGNEESLYDELHQFFWYELPPLMAGRELLLLVDEYELLEDQALLGNVFVSEAVQFMASVLDADLPASLMFTGSRRIEEADQHVWQRLLARAFHRRIGFLARGDAERLVCDPVEGRVVYQDGAVDAILRLTAGQPFYTQVVCQGLVDRLNEARRSECSREDVAAVAAGLTDNPLPQMIYWWKSLPFPQQVALSATAELLDDDHAYLEVGRLDDPLQRYPDADPPPPPLPEMLDAAQSLVDAEILERDTQGRLRVRADLLRRWVRVEHPVWDTLQRPGRTFRRLGRSAPRWRTLLLPFAAGAVLAGAAAMMMMARRGDEQGKAPQAPPTGKPIAPGGSPAARALPEDPPWVPVWTAQTYHLGTKDDAWDNGLREVTLSPFEIRVVPATNREMRGFDPAWPWDDDKAARGATWDRARDYCLGQRADLPTEAQWEAAAHDGLRTWEREDGKPTAQGFCEPPADSELRGMLCRREWTLDDYGPIKSGGRSHDPKRMDGGDTKVVRGAGPAASPDMPGMPHPAYRVGVERRGSPDITFRCARPLAKFTLAEALVTAGKESLPPHAGQATAAAAQTRPVAPSRVAPAFEHRSRYATREGYAHPGASRVAPAFEHRSRYAVMFDLTAVLRGEMPRVQRCYETELKRQPELGGRLTLLVRVGERVEVSVDGAESTLRHPEMETCVRNVLQQALEPSPGSDFEFTVPLVFQPSG